MYDVWITAFQTFFSLFSFPRTIVRVSVISIHEESQKGKVQYLVPWKCETTRIEDTGIERKKERIEIEKSAKEL